MAEPSGHVERRVDLDWIRIAVFGSLILYHVGMVFVPWSYHVKSIHVEPALEPLMLALNPWRLSLLFLIAGAATRFMMEKTAPPALARIRSRRLLLPLLFGILVIVPPQSYWEMVSRHLYDGSFLTFYAGPYFSFAHTFCQSGPCIILPTWNHLWFVAYLWVYTVLSMLLVSLLPNGLNQAEVASARVLSSGPGLFAIPVLVFAGYRLLLFAHFPQTNAMVGDWYNHALYFSMFTIGFLIARSETVWNTMVRWRHSALAAAALVFASYIVLHAVWPPGLPRPVGLRLYGHMAMASINGAASWPCWA